MSVKFKTFVEFFGVIHGFLFTSTSKPIEILQKNVWGPKMDPLQKQLSSPMAWWEMM